MNALNYNFSHKFSCSLGTEIGVDPEAKYGYWERADGSEGGGLWFEPIGTKLDLMDYDGAGVLPRRIVGALIANGYSVDTESFC